MMVTTFLYYEVVRTGQYNKYNRQYFVHTNIEHCV